MAKPQYNETVEVLVQAYENNKLELSNAYADVIGTLVAAALGYEIKLVLSDTSGKESLVWMNNGMVLPYPNYSDGKINGWLAVFFYHADNTLFIKKECLRGEALKQIHATGYKATELLQILEAFRSQDCGLREDRIYYGLIKVLDTLEKIHLISDKDLVENNISRVKVHYKHLRAAFPETNLLVNKQLKTVNVSQ